MSAMDACETGLLSLIFTNANGPANIGDATGLRGSTTAGNFFISLHTANPGTTESTGTQLTSEAAYGGPYARQSTARATGAGGWLVTGATADNVTAISFPACTSLSESETHFGVGSASSGAGVLHFWGALTAPLAVSTGITPSFAVGALDVTLD